MKTITIESETWFKLTELKLKQGFKSMNELIDHYVFKKGGGLHAQKINRNVPKKK
tara:strand:+ start:251 stop:415 length:165 start_codon:yes stop_codon:yes gene_type:complete